MAIMLVPGVLCPNYQKAWRQAPVFTARHPSPPSPIWGAERMGQKWGYALEWHHRHRPPGGSKPPQVACQRLGLFVILPPPEPPSRSKPKWPPCRQLSLDWGISLLVGAPIENAN